MRIQTELQPPLVAVCSGEPAGIGPELCVQLAQRAWPARLVVLGDLRLLQTCAQQLSVPPRVIPFELLQPAPEGVLEVLDIPLRVPSQPGRLDPANAAYVLSLLDRAIDACVSGAFAAMVTAPVHKGVINDSGIHFTGHTEYLAARTASKHVVMMLVGGGLRLALATTHLPLAAVAAAITPQWLEETLRILDDSLRCRFALASPRIAVAGLNPHAGEGGHLGREEVDVIIPVLQRLRQEGLQVYGPLSADTLFLPQQRQASDAVLAMYHDQGLPVLKFASFGQAVNITLGLPIVRTSVDHGTALELAGQGRADSGSLFAAVELAVTLSGASQAT